MEDRSPPSRILRSSASPSQTDTTSPPIPYPSLGGLYARRTTRPWERGGSLGPHEASEGRPDARKGPQEARAWARGGQERVARCAGRPDLGRVQRFGEPVVGVF